jgi:2-dehydro-3-deoxygalactonokinase
MSAATASPSVWVGVDWGTTHRRLWAHRHGEVVASHADDQGLLASAPQFGASLDAALRHLSLDPAACRVVMSGMVGSAQGWRAVPYLDASLPLAAWPQHLVALDTPAPRLIVPGLRWSGPDGAVDVMRGEETQLLGALHLLGALDADGWFVLPGTHSKWVRLRHGRVASLRTHLSGELHGLLTRHGTLGALLHELPHEEVTPGSPGFDAGVAAAGQGSLAHGLFGGRARVVTGMMPREHLGAYLSGILLGSEWHDTLHRAGGALDGPVRIIGSPGLAELHAHCARAFGVPVQVLDVQAVQRAAWAALGARA